jgi:hypothetical protein
MSCLCRARCRCLLGVQVWKVPHDWQIAGGVVVEGAIWWTLSEIDEGIEAKKGTVGGRLFSEMISIDAGLGMFLAGDVAAVIILIEGAFVSSSADEEWTGTTQSTGRRKIARPYPVCCGYDGRRTHLMTYSSM